MNIQVQKRKRPRQTETLKPKTRLMVRQGNKIFCLKIEEIVLFVSERKLTYALDAMSQKYLCRQNLASLASMLDDRFFRANRQYIINIDYLKAYEAHEKVKLIVELRIPNNLPPIIIGQENSKGFRKWVFSH